MRYHWIRDRVAQKEFVVYWHPGTDNLADFFTKALPVHLFKAQARIMVHCAPTHGVIAFSPAYQLGRPPVKRRNFFATPLFSVV